MFIANNNYAKEYNEKSFLNTKIEGIGVSRMTKIEIVETISSIQRDEQKLTISVGEDILNPTYSDLGISIDIDSTVEQVRYKDKSRFSIFESLNPIEGGEYGIVYKVNEETLRAYLENIGNSYYIDPKNASMELSATEKKATIIPDERGARINTEKLVQDISDFKNNQFKIEFVEVLAEVLEGDLLEKVSKINNIFDNRVSVNYGGQRISDISSEVIFDWFYLDENKNLILNQEASNSYINNLASAYYQAPTSTKVYFQNGVEQRREEGVPGLAIDTKTAQEKLAQGIVEGNVEIEFLSYSIQPEVQNIDTLTPNNDGLQHLLSTWEAKTLGQFGLIIEDMSGRGLYAEHQPDIAFVTASTFKMFLAYAVLLEVENGNIMLSDDAGHDGKTVDECIYIMIHYSTNPCSVALGFKLGWEKVDTVLAEAGFTSTRLSSYDSNRNLIGDKYSTARDEKNFMVKLHNNQLLNIENTNKLINLFQNQIWRKGLPAGTPHLVANKVGFIPEYRSFHDVGVVYHPKGKYIITILSIGGNNYVFAELSALVDQFYDNLP